MITKRTQFTRKVRDESGSVIEQAENAMKAARKWIIAGAPLATAEQKAKRAEICGACEKWDGDARLGLGKCKAKGCGCTALKIAIATEECPLGKWGSVG